MQDNEFDNLFRSKLDDFEAEPSVNVWPNIDAGLYAGNRRRLLVPLLSAAASIIVLVTAGVLLIPNRVKDTAGHHGKNNIAMSDAPVKTSVINPANTTKQVAGVNATTSSPVHIVALQSVKTQAATTQKTTSGTVTDEQPAAKQPTPDVIAAVAKKPDTITQPKQINSIAVAANNASALEIKPIQAVIPDKQAGDDAAPQPAKKHRIHSLGDMLNTVIAAVDKRKDKLVEFTDTDDDESVITGINLGIVAVKKQN